MRKEVVFLLGLAATAWLSYVVWLTGYRTGYEQGEEAAWSRARVSLRNPDVVELQTVAVDDGATTPNGVEE